MSRNEVLPGVLVQRSLHVWRSMALAYLATLLLATHSGRLKAEPLSTDQLGPAAPIVTDDQKYPEVEQALARFQQRDYEGALARLQEAAKKYPQLAPPRVLLGRMFQAANQYQAARAQIEQAAADDPADPEAYLVLGDFAFQERRIIESELLFERAAQLTEPFTGNADRKKSFYVRIHAGLAAVDEARQKWTEAREHLSKWLELDPDSPNAHQRMGQILFHLDQFDDAYAELKLAAKKSDQFPYPAVSLARLYEQAGRRDDARKYMLEALREAPKDLKTRLAVAEWLWQTNQLSDARKQAEEAVKLAPDSLEAKLLAGVIARYMKHYSAARQYFESAHLMSPGNFVATNQLALVLIEDPDESNRKMAVDLAERNFRQAPNSPDAAATLGWVYFKSNRMEEAANALKVAQQRAGGRVSNETAYFMASVAYERGQANEARMLLDYALKVTGPFAYRADAERLLASAGGPAAPTTQPAPAESTTP